MDEFKKNHKAFKETLKEELIDDELIDKDSRHIEMFIDEDTIRVNGKDIPEQYYDKYRDIISEHYTILGDGNWSFDLDFDE